MPTSVFRVALCTAALLVAPAAQQPAASSDVDGLSLLQVRASALMGRNGRSYGPDDASLDQAGYEELAALQSTPAMSSFITRVVESLGGAISDKWALGGFAPFHSGEQQTQNFKHLVAELKRAKWTGLVNLKKASATSRQGSHAVALNDADDGPALNQTGYAEVAATHDSGAMKHFIGRCVYALGGNISDEHALRGFVPHHSGEQEIQDFDRLVVELRRAEWTGLAHAKDETEASSTATGSAKPAKPVLSQLGVEVNVLDEKVSFGADDPTLDSVFVADNAADGMIEKVNASISALAIATTESLAIGAQTVALDAGGYQQIAALQDKESMALFIQRLVGANGGEVVADVADDLRSLALRHSAGSDAESFETLVHELRVAPWTGAFTLSAEMPADVPSHTASLLEGQSSQAPPPAATELPRTELRHGYIQSDWRSATLAGTRGALSPGQAIPQPDWAQPVLAAQPVLEEGEAAPTSAQSKPETVSAGMEDTAASILALPLNQLGYKQAVEMHDTAKMCAFIERVVESFGGHVRDEMSLKGFAPFHSGELGEQTFERLVEELRGFQWAGLAASLLPAAGDATHIHIGAVTAAPTPGAWPSAPPVASVTPPAATPAAPAALAAGPTLDQAGYKSVTELRSTAAMQDYIRRIIESMGGHVADMNSLKGFAPYHSGERGEQTYDRLVGELRGFKWTGLKVDAQPTEPGTAAQPPAPQAPPPQAQQPPQPSQTPSLDQSGYKQVVNMHSTAAMSDFIEQVVELLGGRVESRPSLKGFAPFHSGELGEQTYARLVKELYTFQWTGLKDAAAGQDGPAGQQASPASAIATASAISAAVADLAPVSALTPAALQPPPAAAAVQPVDVMGGKMVATSATPSMDTFSADAPSTDASRGITRPGNPSAFPALSKPPTIFAEVSAVESSGSGGASASGSSSMPASQVVQTATFDEAGYQRVAELRSTDAMLAYMKRVARNGGGLTLGPKELVGLVPLHSGEKMVQSYGALCRDLGLKGAAAGRLAMMETSAAVAPLANSDGYVAL